MHFLPFLFPFLRDRGKRKQFTSAVTLPPPPEYERERRRRRNQMKVAEWTEGGDTDVAALFRERKKVDDGGNRRISH